MSVDATRWAWSQKDLRPAEKLVLLSLADRAAEDSTCFPSNKRLQDDTGLDRKTIITCIQALIDRGLVCDTGERRGQTKQIRVLKLVGVGLRENNSPESGTVPKVEQSPKRNSSENGTVPKTDIETGERVPFFPPKGPKNGTRNLSGNLPDKRTYQTIAHAQVKTCAFDEFWAAYPRKKSKGQARRTWENLEKKRELPDLGVILAAIAAAKAGQDWQRDGGKFIPYPATWLNATGWEDERACDVGCSSAFAGAL